MRMRVLMFAFVAAAVAGTSPQAATERPITLRGIITMENDGQVGLREDGWPPNDAGLPLGIISSRVLRICAVGDHCLISATFIGHGDVYFTKLKSAKKLKKPRPQKQDEDRG